MVLINDFLKEMFHNTLRTAIKNVCATVQDSFLFLMQALTELVLNKTLACLLGGNQMILSLHHDQRKYLYVILVGFQKFLLHI